MNAVKISFALEKLPCCGTAEQSGHTLFSFCAEAGRLVCSVLYTAHAEPLHLTAEIQPADRIDILLLPYRIELYRNGVLTDEEWPEGQLLLTADDNIRSDVHLRIEEIALEPTPEEPIIQGTLHDAEGWRPEEHVFVGDCMPYVRDGVYHVLYLKDRHHHRSKWGLGAHQWAHLSTSDFSTWSVHPMAVPITDPDEGSICTGSWIRRETTDYLFYTIRKSGGRPAPICRSLSKDGYHFEKDPSFGFVLPEQYCRSSARDPKVICGDDGFYHMFLTTSLLKEQKGCLAHLVSTDLDTWQDSGCPIWTGSDSTQPECPDYLVYHGKYYLIYSLHGRAHYLVSDRPFDGWRVPEDPIIPCASVPKGAVWAEEIVFAGFRPMGGYGGTMTFKRATADETGLLRF